MWRESYGTVTNDVDFHFVVEVSMAIGSGIEIL
jgi:hypothetical protein